jgi:hypothetical protein
LVILPQTTSSSVDILLSWSQAVARGRVSTEDKLFSTISPVRVDFLRGEMDKADAILKDLLTILGNVLAPE